MHVTVASGYRSRSSRLPAPVPAPRSTTLRAAGTPGQVQDGCEVVAEHLGVEVEDAVLVMTAGSLGWWSWCRVGWGW